MGLARIAPLHGLLNRTRMIAGRPVGRSPRILLVGSDPYLAFLLRLEFPEAEMVEAPAVGRFDLALVDLDGPQASDFLVAHQPPLKIIGIVQGQRASRMAEISGVESLLLRPLVPAELHRAIRSGLGIDDATAMTERDQRPWFSGWVSLARAAMVVLAGLLQILGPGLSPLRAALLVVAIVYAGTGLLRPRTRLVGTLADVALAALAIALTGGVNSPYAGLGLVASMGTGLALGSRFGPLAGLLPAVAAIPLAIVARGTIGPRELVAWIAIFPLASLIATPLLGGSGADGRAGRKMLTEANGVLSTLFRIARTMPGGFDINSVGAASLEELALSLHAPGGALLLREAGIVKLIRSTDSAIGQDLFIAEEDLPDHLFGPATAAVASTELPGKLAAALGDFPCWVCTPLQRDGVIFGTLMAACRDHAGHQSAGLVDLADQTALALENARLFARVRELSADEERRRLARDLHDGVAQALMHVRLELEMLARQGSRDPESVREETARLARVTGRALADVRSTISGLNPMASGGLSGALRSYVRDLQSLGGPAIGFEARGDASRAPAMEAEVFRVAQEAASNALRHAGATQITVFLDATPTTLRLWVQDDGVGIGRAATASTAGFGLDTMRERARCIGGRLTVGRPPGGGTRVELFVDETPAGLPASPSGMDVFA
jgi:signal transduction histidine kinase